MIDKVAMPRLWEARGPHWYYNRHGRFGGRWMCAYCGQQFFHKSGGRELHTCEKRKVALAQAHTMEQEVKL